MATPTTPLPATLALVAREATTSANPYALYQYTPSLAPAIIAAGIFIIAGLAHIYYLRRYRMNVLIPLVIGCFMEAIGYGGRVWSHYDTNSIGAFIIQAILILIAPALFAATIYMLLARIIIITNGQSHTVIPLRFITKIFVIGDCVSFFVQAGGGGIQSAGTLDLVHIGEKVIVAGLFIQIFFFGFFLVTAIVFNIRINKAPKTEGEEEVPWRKHMNTLYITAAIILVRSVFRVVEYLMGNEGFILKHEYMLYIFDTILMLIVVFYFLWKHPGTLFGGIAGPGKSNREKKTESVEFELLESR